MSGRPLYTYEVPVVIADERRVTVKAHDAAEAQEKVSQGRYQKLGKSLDRGFLIVKRAEQVDDA